MSTMPASSLDANPAHYSRLTGFVYVFNLIVGTGALTLPAAFHDAGWGLSSAVLVMLAFMSYLTTTFMIESMASANAMINWKRSQIIKRAESVTADDDDQILSSDSDLHVSNVVGSVQNQTDDESEPLLSVREVNLNDVDGINVVHRRPGSRGSRHDAVPASISSFFNITEIIEMGRMASLFFNRFGRTLFYLCIAIYLYGDLAIYSAAVAKSLRDVACTYRTVNATNLTDESPCWANSSLTRINAYRISLSVFIGVVGPFGFFNVTKTKYLQMLTTLMRWLAFTCMITLACVRLANGQRADPAPPVAIFSGVPNLFGVCVYSFMCHHSLPSLITPISKKQHVNWLIFSDFLLVLMFYTLLAFTGIFAFTELNDLYTLNFQPVVGEPWYLSIVHYFLSLFPVFTLSTNFPIITITLRNNLKALFLTEGRRYSWYTRNCLFPLLALIPPVGVAFTTSSIEFLVGITGSYAGAGIQYVVPAFLVYYSRKTTKGAIGVAAVNHHESWFRSTFWVIFVNCWAIGCVVLVTWNHIANAVSN